MRQSVNVNEFLDCNDKEEYRLKQFNRMLSSVFYSTLFAVSVSSLFVFCIK